ncbi:MAG: OmpH family outer membrane protein [Bradyrhizobiaceae bacterium]|nr:OmpH family outer membrane protein [Bradyrhizobiaceae bacterium]
MVRSLFVVLAIGILSSALAFGQSFKAAYVNSETIIKELPEAIAASKHIDEMGQKIRDTLQIMQKEFEERILNYRKQESMMTADARQKEETAINGLRTRFMQYQEQKTAEVQQIRENFLKPIREKVQAAIEAIAKEEKLNLVLDKVAGIVLYSEDKADITYKVLDRMKRGEK